MKARILPGAVAALVLLVATADLASATPRPQPQKPTSTTRQIVEFDGDYALGTIVIRTSEKRLYYTLGDGQAVRYPIAVGQPKFQWSGELWVSSKQSNPGWRPTPRMRRENPGLPEYVSPGPHNPLGLRAMYIGWSEYRIHGTNAPSSIGSAVSSGCFRMHNADAIDLFDRVHIGAPVIVQH
jgi:lipoprotein-anchoring transpeptidase ErfK/SrfK